MSKLSQREVTRRYKKMVASVEETGREPKGPNVWVCECGNIMRCRHLDYGTTPMTLSCWVCQKGSLVSKWQDTMPDLPFSHEWYRPSLRQTLKLRTKRPQLVEHILLGGLEIRKVEM